MSRIIELGSEEIPNDRESVVFLVPEKIKGLEQFFNIFRTLLNFPSYFGFNWDAFDECINDLHWITYRDVWIVFNDIPIIGEDDISVLYYLLRESVDRWNKTNEINLNIVIPRGFAK
ncbi:barstar family protein [Asaia astilbis]|uniref:barstar family protein n=1 Tax=Asaia astilbis TaxID=610244 RepID=UPI000470B8E3